ncbi:DNA-3-methyladenine glycosylase I [Chromobacterium vaccinii]|uniref:DNA-3-methyladenine glycosylase I n=1 Tax=Chromobacterium vaccinii TaxID=1108595 RepID=UPI000E18F585|nr:DNA-3-methyladenine glycosylase I [Chromobacterium vaccinii]SUX55985.1 DNA-3-methyladenine glycosylase 1 [Chromobacterium vaccinii]
MNETQRCPWCGDDPLYVAYHDEEWGRPERDDRKLFEMLILEGAQAGLSWITILKNAKATAPPSTASIRKSGGDDRRRRGAADAESNHCPQPAEIHSAIRNAKVFLRMQQEHGSFADWLWAHVDGKPILRRRGDERVPASTELSDLISKALKKAGMNFVGSTVIYAYLQACGVVNDHLPGCFLHPARAG